MPPVRRASCLGSACVDTALPLERFVVSSSGLRQVVRSGAASVRHLAGGWERAALLRPQPRAHHRRLPQRERRPTSLPRTTAPPSNAPLPPAPQHITGDYPSLMVLALLLRRGTSSRTGTQPTAGRRAAASGWCSRASRKAPRPGPRRRSSSTRRTATSAA